MHRARVSISRSAWRGLPLLALALACQRDQPLEPQIRRVTYPPDFHYVTQQEIRTTMDRLAVEVATLEAIMEKGGGPQAEDRPAIVASLERMEDLAAQLDQGERSNHPRIGADAPRLRATIERALLAARTQHPTYYDVGRVVGACMYCHAPQDAPPRESLDPAVRPEPDPDPRLDPSRGMR